MARLVLVIAVVAVTLALALPAAAATDTAQSVSITSVRYPRCSALNRRYPHGRVGAHDHTSGTPVTNFTRCNTLYRQNSSLDRDKDGIACEKA
jgi:hypothetical protein